MVNWVSGRKILLPEDSLRGQADIESTQLSGNRVLLQDERISNLSPHLFQKEEFPGCFLLRVSHTVWLLQRDLTGAQCFSFSVASRRDSRLSGPISFGMQFVTDDELLKYSMLRSLTEAKLGSVLFLAEGETRNSHFGGADLPAEPQEHLELHQLCPELLTL